MKMIGLGSQYAFVNKDSNGDVLDGGKEYRLRIPAEVPLKDFWSIVVYDPQTRSELQTSQPFPSKNNLRDPLVANPDGSVDLYFGPTRPDDEHAANWTQTVEGKGWFAILRLYGPSTPGSTRPGGPARSSFSLPDKQTAAERPYVLRLQGRPYYCLGRYPSA